MKNINELRSKCLEVLTSKDRVFLSANDLNWLAESASQGARDAGVGGLDGMLNYARSTAAFYAAKDCHKEYCEAISYLALFI